jgi:hypothetical protein
MSARQKPPLSSAGLYQLNAMVPQGLGTGDVSLQATMISARSLLQLRFWHINTSEGAYKWLHEAR